MRAEAVKFIFDHLFMPPKLPQTDHDESGADDLLKEISQAARNFARSFPALSSERRAWMRLSLSIVKWIDLYDNGVSCSSKITSALEGMRKDDILLFYIKPQNAAIVVRNRPRGAVFECFEVLAKTNAVLAAKDALLRHFPARAVFLPEEKLADASFMKELGNAIHKLSVEKLKMAMETTRKGKTVVAEERQSAHPRAVTEWLFSVLGSCGTAAASPVVCKRVHDDVCWKNADLPWRRSSIWLSARVALQLALHNAELEGEGHSHYKNFQLFLLSRLAADIATLDNSPDCLHVLRVKLARRNAKLGSSTFESVQKAVTETLKGIDDSMRCQWAEVVKKDKITVQPVPLEQVSDRLLLKNSRSALQKIWVRAQKSFTYSFTSFVPASSARATLLNTKLPKPGIFEHTGDVLFRLVDFELWVEESLASWSVVNRSDPSACRSLYELMQRYHKVAKSNYESHAERNSIMLLTIFELWVAIDLIASTIHPLLLLYPPEIPATLFGPLLLSKRSELERLSKVELHIKSRESRCTSNSPSLFSDPSPNCFAVRFYDEAPNLQALRIKVEDEAQKTRDAKSDEWEEQKQKFDKLMKEADGMECGVFVPRGVDSYGRSYTGKPRHHRNCWKCAKEKKAQEISISKHEWPLPDGDTMCKAVIFELGAPASVVFWRDATFFLLQDIGRTGVGAGQVSKQEILSYAPLEKHAGHKNRRITLASSVKPIIKSHYIKSSLNVDPVFVSNGLQPRMKDTSKPYLWTAEESAQPSLQRYCISKLTGASEDYLSRYVNSTTHTTNMVIARQSMCPPEMSPHECVLFGSLRSGERLQLFNVLAGLMSPEIDLNSPETASLIRHAISQVGTPRTTSPLYLRESQTMLEDEQLSRALMRALEDAFASRETNWKQASATFVLLEIGLKILSLSQFSEVSKCCMGLILRIRQSGLAWIRQMARLRSEQKHTHADTVALKDLSRQILTACLLCRRTYALDIEAQHSMFSDEGAVADYVEASIHLHIHRNSQSDTGNLHIETLLMNDTCLAKRIERHLQVALQRDEPAITAGIQRFWQTAKFTCKWQTVHVDDSSWIKNQTSSKVVHYNLVTGSLLVSGRALSQLPAQYTSNSIYRSVFGTVELDVFTADLEDMEYVSKDEFHGQRIYFGLRGDVLLIRSRSNDETFEAIQRGQFLGDLPQAIVQNSTPWMSLCDGRVVFRSRERPFYSEASDWTLYPDFSSKSKSSMSVGHRYLIDMQSQVGMSICNILRPVEQPENLIMTVSKEETIEIELPRYHLHLYIETDGKMVCRELSAFVDLDQELGTLHGLQSRLILRANGKVAGSNLRTVLIPNGDVKIVSTRPHVNVRIHLGDSDSLTFSQFRIDARLGQLISQDLEAHLYKAYLHAITSFPEPDSLTGRTGTEESLFALSDPITRTCLPLSNRAQAILGQISRLTPVRNFYPHHLKTMQTTAFLDGLPVIAQRDIFFGTVSEIVAHNLKANCLFNVEVTSLSYDGHFGLLDRSHHRTRKLYPSESVASTSHFVEDSEYFSRDQESDLNAGASAAMAGLVECWPSAFNVATNLKAIIQEWRKVNGFDESFTFSSFSSLLAQDFKDVFPRLMKFCRSESVSKESLMFVLSLMAFNEPALVAKLRALLAFAISPTLKALPAPEYDSYDLNQGHSLNRKEILTLVSQCGKEFVPSEGSVGDDSDEDEVTEEQLLFEQELRDQRQLVLERVSAAWPSDTVTLPTKSSLTHYNFTELKALLNGRFAAWHKNHEFLGRFEAFDQALKTFTNSWTGPEIVDTTLDFESASPHDRPNTHFSLLDRMNVTPVTIRDFDESQPTYLDQDLSLSISQKQLHPLLDFNQASRSLEDLEEIVEDLTNDPAAAVREYGQFLGDSIEATKSRSVQEQPKMEVPSEDVLASKLSESKRHITFVLSRTRELLQPRPLSEQGLVTARIWPQASELTLLQLLSAEHRKHVPHVWMPILLQFAKEITAAQRVERLQKFLAAEDTFALNNELANPAHSAWSPEKWPDWLLLECQNNVLIRPVQIRVATELLKPQNGTVLLGMGEGKTSILLPMVATALAHGSQLVRIVVLKPLAQEMLRLLSRSLAGLVGRALYYLPFSRQTALTSETPQRLMSLYQECRQTRGILLTLPEYLNSFRLVGVDKLSPETNDLATELIRVQNWLDQHARDIADESDELMKPAYELVYTNGEANLLSGAPDRWNVALEILDVVRKDADALHAKFPNALEVEARGKGSFPHVRVLNDIGTAAVANLVAQAVVDGKLPSLGLGHCDPEVLEAISAFILNVDVEKSKLKLLTRHFQESTRFDLLYVARGLVAHQILRHTLGKRWLVNYGLDRTRTLSAVPYRAKAVPSPSAEFAQPEAAIILTALSFYYTGLLRSDLRRCLLILLRLPDPADAYVKWVRHSTLPTKFHKATSINLDDAYCIEELYSHLRHNSELINFFLRHVVYPSEAKEFRYKLSTSAWDLCRNDDVVTVGFSGTCDSKIPIVQKDLPDLKHITATTLTTLLRWENRHYVCAASASGRRLTTKELLQRITSNEPPDVIIDVGAQMLEGNLEIAQMWLQLCEEKLATVFFNENDEKMVLNRDGSTEPLASSIFKEELGSCLIFLDEFHTRGTDFQLPDKFTAAVLLGPGVLKDNLAQACMRMRKLAVSQRVKFYAPPEVDQAIRSILKNPSEELSSLHVVRWAIHQSCLALKKQGPLYATRGLLHSRRRLAAERHMSPEGKIVNVDSYLDTVRERECRPVSELYCVGQCQHTELPFEPTLEEARDAIVQDLLVEFERTNVSDYQDGAITQEQEREILHEVEEERELQRPREVQPATHQSCQTLLDLIRNGTSPTASPEIRPCFEILKQTRLARHYNVREFPMHLLVTQDFMRTIKTIDKSPQDDFLRSVQWVVKTWGIAQPVIISPHEAQLFLPAIRKSTHTTLYMYQARTSRDMVPFDGLDICKIPQNNKSGEIKPQSVSLLNLFAGQLYFSSFEHYKQLCALIGLFDGERLLSNKREVGSDNYVSPACRQANEWAECTFKTSPVSWIKAFIDMRRLGVEWSHTHMGRILNGRILRREEFEEASDFELGDLAKEMAELGVDEKQSQDDDEEGADE